jgi:hypothetical protein
VNRLSTFATVALVALASVGMASRAGAQEATPAPSETASAAPTETAAPAQPPVVAPEPTATPPKWVLRLTPYIWVPTINASFRFSHPSVPAGTEVVKAADVRIGPNSYLSHVNSAGELTVEADKEGLSLFGDVIYMNVGNAGASVVDLSGPLGHLHLPVNVSTSARLTMTLSTVGVGGEYFHTDTSSASAFVGLRYFDITATTGWTLTGPLGRFSPSGNASENKSDLAGIIGTRARIGLGSHWYIPLYVDYGGSSYLTTYQWFAGIAHRYHSGAQILVWRQLSYFQNPGESNLIQDIHLGGPTFAWSFYL